MAAIGSCFSKDCNYPENPIPMFKDDNEEQCEDSNPKMSPSEIAIRNQVQKAKDALELINGGCKTITGEKRI